MMVLAEEDGQYWVDGGIRGYIEETHLDGMLSEGMRRSGCQRRLSKIFHIDYKNYTENNCYWLSEYGK